MGAGIRSARHLSAGVQRRILVQWNDGRTGFLIVGKTSGWIPFHATVVTENAATQFVVDSNNLYRALLEATLPYLAGQTAAPPVPLQELIEPELTALAARSSWLDADRAVSLSDLTETDIGYDGAVFAVDYRKAKYGE
jgi:hypothetical protein